MAQSESFFGQRRGSTKSLTFQRRDGKQITQDRKEHVRDPRTVDQVQHRCLLHTTIDACTWLAPLFGFAWQGAKTKQKYQDNFRRANYDIIRNAALAGNAGYTYSPYKLKSAPVGYFQIAGGELPYHGHIFGNGINGVDYTETEFINYTAEGERWYSLLSSIGLKVKDTLLLVIIFRDPATAQLTFDTAKVILNDVPDVTIGQQAADSLVTIEWMKKNHNWTVLNNANRILSLRLQHSDYNPSAQVMFTACFQFKKKGTKMAYSPGRLWHWNDNVEGLTFDEALATYPMNGTVTPVEHPVPEELYVDMGLPSGLLWATRNMDVTQKNGFAISTYQYDCSYFSWGNIDGHNRTSQNSVSPYSFGEANDSEPYVSSKGAQIQYPETLSDDNDPATVHCGNHWRTPTAEDFFELIENVNFIDADGKIIPDSVINKNVNVNGIVGLFMMSKINAKKIFISAGGWVNNNSIAGLGSNGRYWTKILSSQIRAFDFAWNDSIVVTNDINPRYRGFTIRPVMEPPSRKGGGGTKTDNPKIEK